MVKDMSLADYKRKYPMKELDSVDWDEQKKIYKQGQCVGVEFDCWYDNTYWLFNGVLYRHHYYVGD